MSSRGSNSMQHTCVILVTLTLAAHYSDGLTIEGRAVDTSSLDLKIPTTKGRRVPMQSKITVSHPAFEQQWSNATQLSTVSPVVIRPSAGKGVDTVKVGLMIMNFFGANLKKHTFSIDMVMSVRWNDTRVVDLIPEGLDQMSMAWNQALKILWMPGIVVTNRDIEQYEIVSASVTIFRSGEVLRVERAQARIMMKYKLQAYPFDTQHLAVRVASSKYMLDEVALVPEKNASGVKEDIWGLYNFKSWEAETYEERDGVLEKSRGMLDVVVKRSIIKYYEDHLIPSFIALSISCAVFYFPFAGPFITARLALSILALLTFTNIMVKSSKELPGSAPFNFNDLFNQQIQALMFITVILNILSEIAFHQFHHERLARTMNNQAKVLMPSIAILNIIIIIASGQLEWMTLERATMVTKATIVLFGLCYVGWVGQSLHEHVKGTREERNDKV